MDKVAALADIDRILTTEPRDQVAGFATHVQQQITLIAACIKRHAPPGSEYRLQADKLGEVAIDVVGGKRRFQGGASVDAMLRSVLRALRSDIEADQLRTFEESVRADVYADLVAQGEALHADGHSRAGVVLVGAALEDHMRKLAAKHGIALLTDNGDPKKATVINADLKKAGAYNDAQKTTIEGWQKLRNIAAHGKPGFEGADDSQIIMVEPMIQGVRGFIAQYPA